MQAALLVLLALVCAVSGFMPTTSRFTRTSTVTMDGKSRELRDRIKSIKNTRRITEAMRLVAAARVRRAQEAVLKTRPLLSQLQLVRRKSRGLPGECDCMHTQRGNFLRCTKRTRSRH